MPDDDGRGLTLWWLPSADPRTRGHLVARGPKGVTYSVPAVFQGWRGKVRWPDGEHPKCKPLPGAIAICLARILGLPNVRAPKEEDWVIAGQWMLAQRHELERLDAECRADPPRFMGSEDYRRLREEVLA